MIRFSWLALGMAALAATSAMAANTSTGLTVAQIAEKNMAARGGKQAWREVKTITMSGQVDVGGKKDTKLPFVMTLGRPNKSRLEIRFQEQTSMQVFDGVHGWKVRPFLGRNEVEPYSPAETKSASASMELDGPLFNYAQKGTKVELLGMEPVEGHNAYKLKLTMKGGEERNLWVDAASFLELKIDGEPRKLNGRPHKVAIYYRDYKTENGLNMPHVLETAVEGVKPTRKLTIEQVKVNPPIDDALFAKPQLPLANTITQ
jgi:outer membrane lipoprotein-sorting protein